MKEFLNIKKSNENYSIVDIYNNKFSNFEQNTFLENNYNIKNNQFDNFQGKENKSYLEEPTQIFSLLKKPNFS